MHVSIDANRANKDSIRYIIRKLINQPYIEEELEGEEFYHFVIEENNFFGDDKALDKVNLLLVGLMPNIVYTADEKEVRLPLINDVDYEEGEPIDIWITAEMFQCMNLYALTRGLIEGGDEE